MESRLNTNPGALAGAAGAEVVTSDQNKIGVEDRTEAGPGATGVCATCVFACAHHGLVRVLMDRVWGSALHLRVPAFVRVCAYHSGCGGWQLTNAWWHCRDWRAQA